MSFEEYLNAWLKMATTKELLMREETLDTGSDPITEEQHKTFKAIMYGLASKLKGKDDEARQARLEHMRRIYMLHTPPDLLRPQTWVLRDPTGNPLRGKNSERQEQWESEVDRLVAWTHSLSCEELEEE